ncbi:MAG: hypothetical protein AAFR04_12055 [Pseudomonadota bacterium]
MTLKFDETVGGVFAAVLERRAPARDEVITLMDVGSGYAMFVDGERLDERFDTLLQAQTAAHAYAQTRVQADEAAGRHKLAHGLTGLLTKGGSAKRNPPDAEPSPASKAVDGPRRADESASRAPRRSLLQRMQGDDQPTKAAEPVPAATTKPARAERSTSASSASTTEPDRDASKPEAVSKAPTPTTSVEHEPTPAAVTPAPATPPPTTPVRAPAKAPEKVRAAPTPVLQPDDDDFENVRHRGAFRRKRAGVAWRSSRRFDGVKTGREFARIGAVAMFCAILTGAVYIAWRALPGAPAASPATASRPATGVHVPPKIVSRDPRRDRSNRPITARKPKLVESPRRVVPDRLRGPAGPARTAEQPVDNPRIIVGDKRKPSRTLTLRELLAD